MSFKVDIVLDKIFCLCFMWSCKKKICKELTSSTLLDNLKNAGTGTYSPDTLTVQQGHIVVYACYFHTQ